MLGKTIATFLPALLVSLLIVLPAEAGLFDGLKEKLQESIDETIKGTEQAIRETVQETETAIQEKVENTEDAVVESVENQIDDTLRGKTEMNKQNSRDSAANTKQAVAAKTD